MVRPIELVRIELAPIELVPIELVPIELVRIELVLIELVPIELVPIELALHGWTSFIFHPDSMSERAQSEIRTWNRTHYHFS